ncbi:MAG TPA: histidine phosphatase family protein [Segeticoccus sp.]|uniref:histidine phosphatase family protein n=1 Tax=Segeticoccus sp. TaxID=2706531 RepID=UPI002D80013C|nr:histidine phosphatase family protein [Segeticoccus sp.]HET8601684.1 histidine phosphatase family protein [Segeticoccus sp.]
MSPAGTSAAAAPARRLIIWRHGQTDHNAQGLWQGHLDTPLSALGRAQAAAAAAELAAYRPSLVVSSDLERAAQTAGALASVTGQHVRYDARFREIHVGEWQGLTAGDVAERYPELNEALGQGQDLPRGVSGETVAQVLDRAAPAAEELLAQLGPGECAVLATHGVTGRALAAALAGIEQHTAWRSLAGLHNGHWALLQEGRHGWRIEVWNAGVAVSAAG